MEVRIDLSHLTEDIAEVQGRIKQAFYADLFLMMAESDRREITAREVDERHEEKMLMLGPVLERLHDELLDPLVTRVFNIMARAGLFADIPLPPALRVEHLQVEFISMLAQAQKAVATGAIERFWQFGGQIAALQARGRRPARPRRHDGGLCRHDRPSVRRHGRPTGPRGPRGARRAAAGRPRCNGLALVEGAKVASEIDVGGGANAVQLRWGEAMTDRNSPWRSPGKSSGTARPRLAHPART